MTRFEIGKTYQGRYIGDHELKEFYTIIKRTEKTVTIQGENLKTPVTRKITIWNDCETFHPEGKNSPLIKAENELKEETTMKKQHTIINASDIHAALNGQEVQPLKKNKKQAPEGISLYDLANEIKNEEKAPAKKTRKPSTKRTASKAAHKRAAEICKQLCFCFEVKPESHYFKDVKNLKELKAAHLELAKIHHPDNGGDAATMAAINAEYDAKVKELAGKEKPAKHTTDAADGMTDEEIAAAIAEEFKATLEKLMALNLDGVKVELIGSWLWVSGNTKPIKDELKALKFRWCPKKDGQPWTWHDSYTYYPSSKGRSTKEDIENKYGVEELKSA